MSATATKARAIAPRKAPYGGSAIDDAVRRTKAVAVTMPELPTETIVLETSKGRILATPVSNHDPLPRYDGAAIDGYAIRRGDLTGPGPWTLRIDGKLEPGAHPAQRPQCDAGGTLEVVRGSPILDTLDAIVPHEAARVVGNRITVFDCPSRNANIRVRGQDARTGTDLLPAGRIITPHDIALMAGIGRAQVLTRQRLKVACLSTGSALVETGKRLGRGEMYDATRPMLAAMLSHPWITYLDLGVVREEGKAFANALTHASSIVDVVIVTGDSAAPIREGLRKLQAHTVIDTDCPGADGALIAATVKGTMILCLPGNPMAATIAMDQFAWPILRTRAGLGDEAGAAQYGIAKFSAAEAGGPGAVPLVRVDGYAADGTPILALCPPSHADNLRAFAAADGFARIPSDTDSSELGTRVSWAPFRACL